MSEKNKRILVVELIAIILSLLPVLLYLVVPTFTPTGAVVEKGSALAEQYEPERILFIAQACIYIGFPLISILASFFFAFFRFEWYLAMSAGPVSFLFACYIVVGPANLSALGITFFVVLLYTFAYAVLGSIIAYPTARLRAKTSKKDSPVINDGRL